MICVVAFCSKDADLQRRNLAWALELDAGCGREGVLSYDAMTPKADVEAIEKLATQYFTKVHHCRYNEPPVPGWPAACNWAWQSTARWMFEAGLKQPWLWLEADAMPLKSGWFLTLEGAMTTGGKSFAGHVVKDMGHMNGVGIYPWDVMRRNEIAMLARAAAWDVVLKASTADDCTNLNHLIQHAWNVHPIDRKMIWNGEGTPLSFTSQADVEVYLDFNAVLLHRIKDGSLIPLLRERVQQERETQRLIMSTEYNVPQHTVSIPAPAAIQPELPDFTGQCEIFIVTYGLPTKRPSGVVVSDFDWLRWCLRSIRKHCTGFSGVTLAIPNRDAGLLAPISNEHAAAKSGIPLRVRMFVEPPEKGMLMHMQAIGNADEYVPSGTTHVLHLDSDCIFKESVNPSEYIIGDKPVYVVRSYESLKEQVNGHKVISDCYQWKAVAERNIGMGIDYFTMLRHPSCFPIDFYAHFRRHMFKTHGVNFGDYVLSCKNEFPQTYAEFPAMGGFAWAAMWERFAWKDVSNGNHLAPRDRLRCYWSHHGITSEVEHEINSFLV